MSAEAPEEIIFEITRIGDTQRVAAVHVSSGVEVVFQTPANTALADVRALAVRMLDRKMNGDDGKPAGPGIVV